MFNTNRLNATNCLAATLKISVDGPYATWTTNVINSIGDYTDFISGAGDHYFKAKFSIPERNTDGFVLLDRLRERQARRRENRFSGCLVINRPRSNALGIWQDTGC